MLSVCKSNRLQSGYFSKAGDSVSILFNGILEEATVLFVTDIFTRALAFEKEYIDNCDTLSTDVHDIKLFI